MGGRADGQGGPGSLRAVLALVAALACAGSPAPDWVRGEASRWPSTLYLRALGTGADAAAAETAARAGLAQRFEPDRRAEAATAASEPGLVRRARAAARPPLDEVLAGTRVVETWQDPRTGTAYALAVLERKPVATELRDEVAERAEGVRLHLGRANSAAEPLQRVRSLVWALTAAEERAVLIDRYAVATGGWSDPEARKVVDQVARDLADALAEVRFAVRVRSQAGAASARGGDAESRSLREAVADALRELGFGVLRPGARDDWVPSVTAGLALEPLSPSGGRAHVRWSGFYEIAGRPPARPMLASARLGGEVDGADPADARAAARREGEAALARDLSQRIFESLRPPWTQRNDAGDTGPQAEGGPR